MGERRRGEQEEVNSPKKESPSSDQWMSSSVEGSLTML